MRKIISLLIIMMLVILPGCGSDSDKVWNGDYAIMTTKTKDHKICEVMTYQEFQDYKAKNVGVVESFSPNMEELEDKYYLVIENEYASSQCHMVKVKKVEYKDNKLVVDLKEKVEMQGLAGSYSLACVILVDKDYEDIEVNRDIKNTSSNMN